MSLLNIATIVGNCFLSPFILCSHFLCYKLVRLGDPVFWLTYTHGAK